MPVPAYYSEAIFADYLVSVLGDVATMLSWDDGSPQVQEAITDTLLDLDVTTIGSVTDMRALRAVGRRAIWRGVVQATTGHYAFTDVAQQTFNRQQVNEQAREMLKLAETDCRSVGVAVDDLTQANYAATVVSVFRPHDPYIVIPDSERTA